MAVVGAALAVAAGTAFGVGANAGHDSADNAKNKTPNPNCTLILPPDPLSAAGLATPYRLTATDPRQGPCHETDSAQSAFVQAVVIDPATGALGVYAPLVIDAGARPAAAPTVPTLASDAVVGIWFGFNGTTLALRGAADATAANTGCVTGLDESLFGQFSYCHAKEFFAAANAAITRGRLKVPALGTAKDGQPCPTVRDFSLVDQDQSDNVTTTYLAVGGSTTQNTERNADRFGKRATVLANGSDNRLLDAFVDPALGCTPFTAPDLADPGHRVSALALNELQAAAGQRQPVALVPPNDPMTTIGVRNTETSRAKTDDYRLGVDQPPLAADADLGRLAKSYCADLRGTGPRRLEADRPFTRRFASPDPASPNLYAFLKTRFAASLRNLRCPS